MKETSFWGKVEIRFIIVIIVAVIVTGASIYYTVYTLTYKAMLDGIKERAEVAYNHSEHLIDLKSFQELNEKADEANEIYLKTQQQLNQIRKIANIKYLYTTKKNESGQYIYIIDGLDVDDKDFRHVGDLIEDEIIPKLDVSFQGQPVYADDIIKTDWGEIFVSYWPVYDETGAVIGTIGMEFDANLVYHTWKNTQKYSIIISSTIMLICIIAASFLFKRVSDPLLKKLAYTDYLTGLKNRTAFELDLKRYDLDKAAKDNLAIAIFDLNDLKLINDDFGHLTGDIYIKKSADVIDSILLQMGESYRIGGDEFASLIINTGPNNINAALEKISEKLKREKIKDSTNHSLAYGFAFYDKNKDRSLNDTFNRADINMYQFKNSLKNTLNVDNGVELAAAEPFGGK